MSAHDDYLDPDNYLGDQEEELLDIDSLIRTGRCIKGYGKQQHGMNGKDADLDTIGQCVVEKLTVVDPTDSAEFRIDIKLRLYATVCAPSMEGFNLEAVRENASPELIEHFSEIGVAWDKSSAELWEEPGLMSIELMLDYFQEQAGCIAEGADPCPDDWAAFMWNDDAWEGGMHVTLSVPLSCEAYEALENGKRALDGLSGLRKRFREAAAANNPEDIDKVNIEFKEDLLLVREFEEAISDVAYTVAMEIYDANEGGTPARDKLKRFEDEVRMWNEGINRLECYHQPS